MNNQERLAKLLKAENLLKKTEHGYTPDAFRWQEAMKLIDEVEESLAAPPPSPVPKLGPITVGGKSVLLHQLTHKTDGIPGFPAFDSAFGQDGIAVLAPEACICYDNTSGSAGGDAFFIRGNSKIEYWVGHITTVPALNKRFRKGEVMTRIANISQGQGGPHCHLGINARPLIGTQLKYGSTGNGPDYTFGSPTVGAQLTAALVP